MDNQQQANKKKTTQHAQMENTMHDTGQLLPKTRLNAQLKVRAAE